MVVIFLFPWADPAPQRGEDDGTMQAGIETRESSRRWWMSATFMTLVLIGLIAMVFAVDYFAILPPVCYQSVIEIARRVKIAVLPYLPLP